MQRWLVFGSVVGVLSASLIGGCSSSTDPYPDQNTFCQAKAQSECNSAQSTTGGIAALCNVDPSTCETARQEACISDANAALAGGLRSYSATGAVACIAAVQSAYVGGATSTVPYATLQGLDTACEQGVFPGSVAAMGTCTTSDDCSTDVNGNQMVCSPVNPGSHVLECATSIGPVALGGECANFGSVCTPGTYCLGSLSTPYTCQSGAEGGEVCTEDKGCATNFYCSMAAGETSGTCLTASNQAGTACSSDISCGGTTAPYCALDVAPSMGEGPGACEQGEAFAPGGGGDCKAFGAK
jgi:hypothetical protein